MEYREVFTINDRFEADLIQEALRGEGIPFQLQHHDESTLEPVFTLQSGWGRVFVPEGEESRALEVIQAVLNARPVESDLEPVGSSGLEPSSRPARTGPVS